MDECCLLDCPFSAFQIGLSYSEWAHDTPLHTVGWTHTNQLALKKMHQSHDHRAV